MALRFILLIFSYLPLAAHFLRGGEYVMAVVTTSFPLLALFRTRTVTRILQTGLVAGVFVVWLPTLVNLVQMRMVTGQPWLRMALILGGVMCFSLLSAWLAKGIIRSEKNNNILFD
ncbi:hypothetical protein [Spongorhabdus nitratireducens]